MNCKMDSVTTTASDVKDLIKRKETIESQIAILHKVLTSNGVGMKELLVDSERYPRSDIDVHSVRHARHQIICLQNDHKQVLLEIESGLHKLHSENKPSDSIKSMQVSTSDEIIHKPFVRVEKVEPASPSSTAGLCAGDEIIQFGSVTDGNFQGLSNIASAVQHSQNMSMFVVVLRQGNRLTLSLTPKTWGGRGLLGCNIVAV